MPRNSYFLIQASLPRGEALLILSSASVQANRLQFMSVLVRPTPVTLRMRSTAEQFGASVAAASSLWLRFARVTAFELPLDVANGYGVYSNA